MLSEEARRLQEDIRTTKELDSLVKELMAAITMDSQHLAERVYLDMKYVVVVVPCVVFSLSASSYYISILSAAMVVCVFCVVRAM